MAPTTRARVARVANEWDWVQGAGTGWDQPPQPQPGMVAPWDQPDAALAPQDSGSGSPVPEGALDENNAYGVPTASGGMPAPPPVEPPPELPQTLPSPLPPGIGKMSMSRSFTGPVAAPSVKGPPPLRTQDDAAAYIAPGMAQQQAARDQMLQTTGQMADVRADNLDQSAQMYQAQADDRLDIAAHRHAVRQQVDQENAAAWSKIERTRPGKLWENTPAFAKAAGMLAAGLGGFYGVYNGGKNSTTELMQQMMEADLRSQEVNAEQQKSAAYATERRGKSKLEEIDERMADSDFRFAAQFKSLEQHALGEMAKFDSPIMKAKLMEEAGKMNMQAGEYLNAFAEKQTDQRLAMYQAEEGRKIQRYQIASENARQKLALAAQERAAAAKGAEGKGADPTRAIKDPTTGKVIGYQAVGAPGDVVKTQEKLNARTSLVNRMQKFDALQEKAGGVAVTFDQIGNNSVKQELLSLHADIIGDMIRAKTGAAATEGERAQLMRLYPLERMLGPDTQRTLASVLENSVSDQDFDIGGFVSDAEGNPVTFGYKSVADRLAAKYAKGSTPTAPATPYENIDAADRSIKAVESGKAPAESPLGKEYVKATLDVLKSLDGASDTAIDAAMAKWNTIPPELRAIPDVNGDKDPVALMLEMKRANADKDRAREAKKQKAATRFDDYADMVP